MVCRTTFFWVNAGVPDTELDNRPPLGGGFFTAIVSAKVAGTRYPLVSCSYFPPCGKTAHTPNAVTIAALEEGDAMTRGEIPANRFHSIEELLADLDS
ncbi:hypothetical protein FACS189476_03610 [Spirochaetia bacterium]|nr:hypothetical protein FACS189476_03610 [Spirochaetia bacterium]